ncbi:hypothetical protein CDAR_94811 [Caerostris darwini]|uniref:Uncharacterized protein n=1 Tax=Caerostris darwini TaxID=1538125 RepID=A0AAV4PIY8_9ARAC|nr:hypothetical protein CDAR_94811 [Caerostris darwini]
MDLSGAWGLSVTPSFYSLSSLKDVFPHLETYEFHFKKFVFRRSSGAGRGLFAPFPANPAPLSKSMLFRSVGSDSYSVMSSVGRRIRGSEKRVAHRGVGAQHFHVQEWRSSSPIRARIKRSFLPVVGVTGEVKVRATLYLYLGNLFPHLRLFREEKKGAKVRRDSNSGIVWCVSFVGYFVTCRLREVHLSLGLPAFGFLDVMLLGDDRDSKLPTLWSRSELQKENSSLCLIS